MELKPIEIALRISAANLFKNAASDADASRFVSLYPTLKNGGTLIKSGTRINYAGKLYRSRVDLWDDEGNTPDKAPDLWEEVLYKRGIRIIPDSITAENPFHKGELGWWNGVLYKSVLDVVNTYTPDQYPSGWETVKEENE